MRQATLDRHRSLRLTRAQQRLARLSQRLGQPIELATEPVRCAGCGLTIERRDEMARIGAELAHLHCALDALRGS